MDSRDVSADLSLEQSLSLSWLIAPVCAVPRPEASAADVFAHSWQSQEVAQLAATIAVLVAGECVVEDVVRDAPCEVRCLLVDRRDRRLELLVSFESEVSGRVTRLCVRPILPAEVEVRAPALDDVSAMARLELSAPVRREDGTEVVIDHNGKQFEYARVVTDHRWLAAFHGGRMVAVQGVAVASAPIDGTMCRIAYNHYSRSDPGTRRSGNLIHLVGSLYRDIHPVIDQFVSLVDVENTAGLRLSFGTPWPTRVRRLFLPVAALEAADVSLPVRRGADLEQAASLLNLTHHGMNLWVPRTPEFLAERQRRAPTVYTEDSWRVTDQAALALWPSGETRTYRKDGRATVRRLALVLDYGFTGDRGREELTGLLRQAAAELVGTGISHLAMFVSDDHPPTQWLVDLADGVDTYAVCAPVLRHPAPPRGPVYVDHILF